MKSITGMLPWLVPGAIVVIVAGLVLARPVARRLGTRVGHAFALVASLGGILVATIPPDGAAAGAATIAAGCDLGRFGLAPLSEYLVLDETGLNVLLFVPLGLTIGLLPASRARNALLVFAVALPMLIEIVQFLVRALDRGCQSADLFDNLLGLASGLVLAGAIRSVARIRAARSV